jgi:hypothetical protein
MQMGRAKAGRCGVLLLTGSRPAGGAAMLAALEPFEQLAAQIIAAGGAKSVDRHLSLKNWQPFLDPPATCDHKQWPGTATCTATLLVTQIASDGGTEPAVGSGFQPVSAARAWAEKGLQRLTYAG